MHDKIYIKIPTWNNGEWEYTEFSTKEDFRVFVKSLFKEPGKYEFDETSRQFNVHARNYQAKKLFCEAPEGSRDFHTFWDTEKEKCRKGVIYHSGDKTWYLTRQYYMWVNYLPIFDKAKSRLDFPRLWDSQYHAFLYELLAQLHDSHAVTVKKRQWGNTYMKMARMICRFWFDEGFTGKLGASLKDYINEKGAWKFLNQYRDFLNKNTAWYRPMDPEKVFSWQQRLKVREGGRDSYEGLKSTITGTSFEKDATAGVGGNISEFYHEEAGIAPKLDQTYEFMRPALSAGGITTGLFIASGSVGDLDQCTPLQNFMKDPFSSGFYGVETNLIDEHGTTGIRGLFIPEQWSYEVKPEEEPCIDEYGNSLVEKALTHINKIRAEWRKTLTPDIYQLRISQQPTNIREAFAIRKQSVFPVRYTAAQARRIEENEYSLEYVDLIRGGDNKISTRPTDRQPCVFPTDIKGTDKRGAVVIHEHPAPDNRALNDYLASVDPVAKGISQNSDSLASVYIYKMPKLITKKFNDGTTETFTEGGKLVAWWTGRYDDVSDTNEQISMLVEYFQAYATCEANVGSWIDYMRGKRRQRYLSLKEDMIFDSELSVKQGTNHKHGWWKTTQIWGKLLEYGIDSLSIVNSQKYDENEVPYDIHYGVEQITDIWLLREMEAYDVKSGNYDRVVAYCALMAFADLRIINLRGLYQKQEKVIREEDKLVEKDNIPTFKDNRSPFKSQYMMGSTQKPSPYQQLKNRSPFKHLR